MFKSFEETIDILGVCLEEPRQLGGCWPTLFQPSYNAKQALDLMAARKFDLVLVGSHLPDMDVGNFLRLLKDAYPRQKWALAGGPLTPQQRSLFREYGAIKLFDAVPTTVELAYLIDSLRQQAIESVLNGTFLPPAQLPQRRAIAG
jgi:DNA-binding NarL/FixJ family response regulator